MKIGEIIPMDREITLNEGKPVATISVANVGDRPVQVGSHFHFFEVNRCLKFDREKAYGFHLDIPSGRGERSTAHRHRRNKAGLWIQRSDLFPDFGSG